MPRMDGFELLRRLKERGDLTPAIALTAFGSMDKALSAVHDLKAFGFWRSLWNHAPSESYWIVRSNKEEVCRRPTNSSAT